MATTNGKVKRVYVPHRGHYVTFTDRQAMKVGHPKAKLHIPPSAPPPPKLPIDWANTLYFPLEGNDIYGDCMMAAAEHADNTFTGNIGAESSFDAAITVSSYLSLSGGDNGLNSGQIVSAWEDGLPGVPAAKIMDSMDIDTKDATAVQTAIWLFGGVFFTLDVPDAWYNHFKVGAVWDAPAKPDSNNGHGVWWNGTNSLGNYHMETWGSFGWISPAGVADCDPAGFVVFSQRWFNRSGQAPNGYSYSQLASLCSQMGGKTLPEWPAVPKQGNLLVSGQGLLAGNSIKSDDQRFTLKLQTDGNLVLHGPQNQRLWASNTGGKQKIFDAILQADGNFVLYTGDNQSIWASNTNGNPDAWLTVQNDGNVVIYDTNNRPLWSTNSTVPAEPASPTQFDRLLPGQGLVPGASIKSTDGRFTLAMQTDGNLVLYGPGGQPLWASNTGQSNIWEAVMQGDGNFVVYDGHSHPLWASNTNKPGAWLIVQNDGNVVIYDTNDHPLWATNTTVPAEPAQSTVAGRLLPGQGLIPGGAIRSVDGRFTLVMQADGDLVLYGPAGQPLWASNTSGHANVWEVVMQGDGNLVIYDEHGRPLWASNTSTPGAWLIVQNDGNVVIYDINHRPIWATNTVVPAEPPPPTQIDRLFPGQGLLAGKSLTSANGRMRFAMQADGNLVLYDWYNQPLWASHTKGRGQIWDVVMQTDGNLVIYDDHSHPLWASNTSGKPGATLTVQEDGNVVIYDTNGQALWATNTQIGGEILKG